MQTFRFRLDKVLSWRRAELQREEASLAPLFAELHRLDDARNQLQRARENAESGVATASSVYGNELEALSGFRLRLDREQAAIGPQRAKCEERISGQRARVLQALRRVRLLEKLKSRQFDEWRASSQREMESFSSEMFLSRWGR